MFKLHTLHPNLQKKSVEIVFKMSILDLQEAFLSGVWARQVQNEPDTGISYPDRLKKAVIELSSMH